MGSIHSVQVDLSDDLYARIEALAAERQRPVEALVLDSLGLLFGEPPLGWENLSEVLDTFPTEQLWAVVYRRLDFADQARLREMTDRARQQPLSAEERIELDALLDLIDRFMLLRSQALLLLEQRGQDVPRYLQPG